MTAARFLRNCLFLGAATLALGACATNPVTGRSELSLMSEAQELAIGRQQYLPSQQGQGGEYKVDPRLTAYVNEVGQRIAAVSDRSLPYEFVVLNNSVPNAWALPGGKIAVNRGLLLELNSEAELAAVLGHEVVHAAARHTARAASRGVLLQGVLVAGVIASSESQYGNAVVGGAALGAQLITQRYGRDAERESDYYGMLYMLRAGYDPAAAVSLQETFVRLSEGRSTGWLEGLFASHPPSPERVANNRARLLELQPQTAGMQLALGEERYRQELAFLQESRPAYALVDDAYRAISGDDLETALDKADQARALLPAEPRFDGLRGDILLAQRRYREASAAYDEAIRKDDGYFDYYLGRGVAAARLDNRAAARADLMRANELLPTAVALNELGKLSLAEGDRPAAKQYFRGAAEASGAVGQEATLAFLRLDLEDNPQAYVGAQPAIDANRRLYASVSNATGVTLSDVQVEFAALIGGRTRTGVRVVTSLPGGGTVNVDSGLAFPEGVVPTAEMISVRVTAARLP